MKKELTIIMVLGLLFLTPTIFALENVLIADFTLHKNDTVELLGINTAVGTESLEVSDELLDYKVELLSGNDVLYTKYFEPSFKLIVDGFTNTDEIVLDKIQLTLKLKYFDEADKINIYHLDKLIFSQDISMCNNNNKCEPDFGENLISCQFDCASGSRDNYCDGVLDGICDLDCSNQKRPWKDIDCTCGNNICDERENEDSCSLDCSSKPAAPSDNTFFYIIAVLIVAVIIIVFLFKMRHKM